MTRVSRRYERALRGSLGRFLAVGAILLGLIGMHSLLLADPANHGSAPAAATAASDVLGSSAVAPAPASAADVPVAAPRALLSPQGGEHADLIAACVLALLLTAVLLLASGRRLLARFTAGSARPHARRRPSWPPALRTSPAVLAISRT
ncbi:hypothetical protein XM48_14960 [Leucobacter sp. Ag1]|nr:hypothetical protein XM48_14960 [Leucobacter sp. Ag1]